MGLGWELCIYFWTHPTQPTTTNIATDTINSSVKRELGIYDFWGQKCWQFLFILPPPPCHPWCSIPIPCVESLGIKIEGVSPLFSNSNLSTANPQTQSSQISDGNCRHRGYIGDVVSVSGSFPLLHSSTKFRSPFIQCATAALHLKNNEWIASRELLLNHKIYEGLAGRVYNIIISWIPTVVPNSVTEDGSWSGSRILREIPRQWIKLNSYQNRRLSHQVLSYYPIPWSVSSRSN